MKKRILLLIDDMGQGGAERQMSYLAALLQEKKYEIRLVRFYDGDSAYESFLRQNYINLETITKGKSKYKRIITIIQLIRKWSPDTVIVYKDGSGIAACIAKIFCKFKLIVSERNTTQVLTKYEKIKFLSYKLADYIVPNSYSQGEFISKHYPRLKDKLYIITNAIYIDQFERTRKIDYKENKKVVITAARISPQKNVLNYLYALKLIKDAGLDVEFKWFGQPSSKEYFEEVLSLKSKLSLDDFITFHSNGSTNIGEEYALATHFCLPSKYEGFPNVLCEAMSSGLICVASDVCDNGIILNNKKLLFNPLSPENIATVLTYALELNQINMDEIIRNNKKVIKELCSPNIFVNKYINLIEK